MTIYYRADSRSPEEIFKHGFTVINPYSSVDYSNPQWWEVGIAYSFNIEHVSEAYSKSVVCMTTCFESAPIFPVDNTPTTYVYAIELPDNEVYDFYNYQLQQAKDRLLDQERNSGVVAVGLCGYEAFTLQVKPESIIGVVKCNRSELKPMTAGLQIYYSKHNLIVPFDREFTVDSTLVLNSNFKNKDSQLVDETIKNLQSRLTNEFHTTSIASAIEKAGLRKPVTKALIFDHVANGNIKDAIKSIFMSVYYAIKNLFVAVFNYVSKSKKSSVPANVVYLNVPNRQSEKENSCSPTMLPARALHAKNHTADNSFNATKQGQEQQNHRDEASLGSHKPSLDF